jgi:putative SOS response-associated peptidase YedK
MCNKFILRSSRETIEKRFNLSPNTKIEWEPRIIVSPRDKTLIITQQSPKEIILSTYVMTPLWAKQPMNLINARAEGNKNPDNNPLFTGSKGIFMKPAFKRPVVLQRCVVIADAYIEWSNTTHQSYLIYLQKHQRPFGMAGLHDIWNNPDTKAELHSFTIITVPGNTLIHQLPTSRMPVIIPKGRETDWLRPSNHLTSILGMLEIYPAERMNTFPINKNIKLSVPYTSDMLKPVGVYAEVDQKFIQQRHYGHKQKGAGGMWRGNANGENSG